MRKMGHMVPYYTLMEGTMVSSPILAAIASFLAFAATAPPERFTPAAIFAAVALFGILKPPIEDLPHSMVEVRALTWSCILRFRLEGSSTPSNPSPSYWGLTLPIRW